MKNAYRLTVQDGFQKDEDVADAVSKLFVDSDAAVAKAGGKPIPTLIRAPQENTAMPPDRPYPDRGIEAKTQEERLRVSGNAKMALQFQHVTADSVRILTIEALPGCDWNETCKDLKKFFDYIVPYFQNKHAKLIDTRCIMYAGSKEGEFEVLYSSPDYQKLPRLLATWNAYEAQKAAKIAKEEH